MPTKTAQAAQRPRTGERIMAAISRDPLTAPHAVRNDAILAACTAVLATALTLLVDHDRRPDALGWTLLLAAHALLARMIGQAGAGGAGDPCRAAAFA